MNLYQKNIYNYFYQKFEIISSSVLRDKIARKIVFLNEKYTHNIYLNYIEVPITTCCTLRCKDCANLIQYYDKPYIINEKKIIKDIIKLAAGVKKINMLRILGGEPLIHTELFKILNDISQIKNINKIQIVTNGTLLLNEKSLEIIRKNKKISVFISNYGSVSEKYNVLINQLKQNSIKYETDKNIMWWVPQTEFYHHNRSRKEMEQIFQICDIGCISLLDGKLHLCPRSSHGMELGLIRENPEEYVDIRNAKTKKKIYKGIYKLFHVKTISACDICNSFNSKNLPKIKPAQQISKENAKKQFLRIKFGII